MRPLLLLLCLAVQAFGAWPNGYSYRLTEAIDHTKVGTADHTDYPATYIRTYAELAHTTHGGYATDLNGYDIIITSDAAGGTKLDHEIESYNHETGAVIFHFRVPSVSHTADTTFYVFVGNAAVAASQEAITGVWDAAFKGVWHFGDGTTLSATDSTSNNTDGTLTGAPPPGATAGKIGGGASFNGSTAYIDYGDVLDVGTNDFTVSFWCNITDKSAFRGVFGKYQQGGSNGYYFGALPVSGVAWMEWTSTGFVTDEHNGNVDITGAMKHVVFTADRNGNAVIYVNGNVDTTTDFTELAGIDIQSATPLRIGALTLGDGTSIYVPTPGTLDEFRVSFGVRSADWVLTEFNNQSDPATFFTSDGTFEASGTTSQIKSVASVALAGIGKIAGVVIASVKKLAGVAN